MEETRTTEAGVTSRKMMGHICESLRHLRELEGVTAKKVLKYVQGRYGEVPGITLGKLQTTMERGVQSGFLVSKGGKYNLNFTSARGRCGCRPSKRKARKMRGCKKRQSIVKRLMKMLFKKKKKCVKKKKKKSRNCKPRKPRC